MTELSAMPTFAEISEEMYKQNAVIARQWFVQTIGNWAYDALSPFYKTTAPAVPFESLKVGQFIVLVRRITKNDLFKFAEVSGDWQDAHMDPRGVAPFNGAIAHGMLVRSSLSAGLARLPGHGTILEEDHARYRAPVYIGDTITLRQELTQLEPKPKSDLHRVRFDAIWRNQRDEVVIEGWANVRIPNHSFVQKNS